MVETRRIRRQVKTPSNTAPPAITQLFVVSSLLSTALVSSFSWIQHQRPLNQRNSLGRRQPPSIIGCQKFNSSRDSSSRATKKCFSRQIEQPTIFGGRGESTKLSMADTADTTDSSTTGSDLEDPKTMKIGQLKNELESYGMNPKIYLEKSELIDAVVKARAEGKTPIAKKQTTTTTTTTSKTSSATSEGGQKASTPEGGFGSNLPRETRLQLEIDNCSRMKIGELKSELKKLGIRTTTFFEKSEFVRALAEARVDGVKAKTSDDDEEEVVVADVEVLSANDPRGPQKRESAAKAAESRGGGGGRAGASPFGGGASPFGGGGMGGIGLEDLLGGMGGGGRTTGGASPFGGGGMGGIEDLLKNMGGGGASPFGGAGAGGAGMPDMAKVKKMMSNPKVRSIMAKAQNNPRIMKAMQECMSNPAAMAKYQNDPELKKLLDELKPYI